MPDMTFDSRIVEITDRSCASSAVGIPGLHPSEIRCIAPSNLHEVFGHWRAMPPKMPVGFVIDCVGDERQPFSCLLRHHGSVLLRASQLRDDPELMKREGSYEDLDILALASLIVSDGGICVLLVSEELPVELPSAQLMLSRRREYSFRFLSTRRTERKQAFRLAFEVVSAVQCVGASTLSVGYLSQGNEFKVPALSQFLALWEVQEFERDAVVVALRTSRQSFSSDIDLTFRLVFLSAVSLSRMLATRFFERRAVAVNLLLTDNGEHQSLSVLLDSLHASEPLFDCYNFESLGRPPWYHFGDPSFYDGGIEFGLSQSLIVIADQNSGQVLCVHEMKSVGAISESRYVNLCQLSQKGTVIGILPDGYLEVYRSGDLLLWYDRHRYRLLPFQRLHRVLTRHLNNQRAIMVMIGAIAHLMDCKEGSIIVFCSKLDLAALASVLRPMRPQVGVAGSAANTYMTLCKDVDSMSVGSLAAILRTDGCHVVCDNKFLRIAQFVHPDPTTEIGTGRNAARTIAGRISGLVVKISSSGEMHMFAGQKNTGSPSQNMPSE